jgi:hypothetical protein
MNLELRITNWFKKASGCRIPAFAGAGYDIRGQAGQVWFCFDGNYEFSEFIINILVAGRLVVSRWSLVFSRLRPGRTAFI